MLKEAHQKNTGIGNAPLLPAPKDLARRVSLWLVRNRARRPRARAWPWLALVPAGVRLRLAALIISYDIETSYVSYRRVPYHLKYANLSGMSPDGMGWRRTKSRARVHGNTVDSAIFWPLRSGSVGPASPPPTVHRIGRAAGEAPSRPPPGSGRCCRPSPAPLRGRPRGLA